MASTNDAGQYHYVLKRQSPITGGTGYQDTGDIYYCLITDMKSNETLAGANAVFNVDVVIRIRNFVILNATDRLIDMGTGEIYTLTGLRRDFPNNETIVGASRSQFGATV